MKKPAELPKPSEIARFMPNYELIFPPWIGPGGIGHWKGAGRLPTLYPGPPDGWRRGFSRRALIAKWICWNVINGRLQT